MRDLSRHFQRGLRMVVRFFDMKLPMSWDKWNTSLLFLPLQKPCRRKQSTAWLVAQCENNPRFSALTGLLQGASWSSRGPWGNWNGWMYAPAGEIQNSQRRYYTRIMLSRVRCSGVLDRVCSLPVSLIVVKTIRMINNSSSTSWWLVHQAEFAKYPHQLYLVGSYDIVYDYGFVYAFFRN